MSDKSQEKIAVWSISLNQLIGQRQTKVNPTEEASLFVAEMGIKSVPVWEISNEFDDLGLELDEEFKYVWFTE